MSLLIDGYNLLNVAGVSGDRGPGVLHRARHGLLDFLARCLPPEERAATTVVFDAKQAPPGLPRSAHHRGIAVRYAAGHDEADDLIEQLIREDTAPRKLTVVSSDHRVQRAARRRRATAVDSDTWLGWLVSRQHAAAVPDPEPDEKPTAPLSRGEVAAWLRRFGDGPPDQCGPPPADESADAASRAESPAAATEASDRHDAPPAAPGEEPGDKPRLPADTGDWGQIFPPGYADDVIAEEGPG